MEWKNNDTVGWLKKNGRVKIRQGETVKLFDGQLPINW